MSFLNSDIVWAIWGSLSSVSQVSIQVPLSHVMLYTIFLLIFFFMSSSRGIILTSFIFALNLGVMQNSELLTRGVVTNPVLWIPYLLVGTFFFIVLCLGLINYE
jgi:hypothetical protein